MASGRAPSLDAITGTPHANASRVTIENVSHTVDGTITASTAANSDGSDRGS
jgi:hypothetical protein